MERVISQEELRRHDGVRGPAWFAYKGYVYDVSKSFQWIQGKHQDDHLAGIDLTSQLSGAPHGEEQIMKFPKVGKLV